MKEIPLTQGKVALVDDEDYERVIAVGKWYAQKKLRRKSPPVWYARRMYQRKVIWMHVFIMGRKGVDHKDGNGLNNTRANLRYATAQEQLHNKGCGSRYGFKGVNKTVCGTWQARIYPDNKFIHLGNYRTVEEAARAYDQAAVKFFGEFARLNFPQSA